MRARNIVLFRWVMLEVKKQRWIVYYRILLPHELRFCFEMRFERAFPQSKYLVAMIVNKLSSAIALTVQ
tara:strand:- start:5 stop:211 length:207 start_codon:yes stop_codon:yes gene_type:complete